MFDDLQYIIEKAEIPNITKIAISTITKAISWFPWCFVIIGLLLNKEFFQYWLFFFMIVEGILFSALVYVLLLSVRYSIQDKNKDNIRTKSSKKNDKDIMGKSLDGIIGNAAWYFLLFGGFILLKITGIIDSFLGKFLHP